MRNCTETSALIKTSSPQPNPELLLRQALLPKKCTVLQIFRSSLKSGLWSINAITLVHFCWSKPGFQHATTF